jgi:hypothetical protein
LEGNWIPLGQFTCHERRTCWSCLAFCSIDSTSNNAFELHFHIPQEVSFCCFRFENYRPRKPRQWFRITQYLWVRLLLQME